MCSSTVSGPQPDWDPDIVASLDNPDMNFDLDDQLEDDFVLQVSVSHYIMTILATSILICTVQP